MYLCLMMLDHTKFGHATKVKTWIMSVLNFFIFTMATGGGGLQSPPVTLSHDGLPYKICSQDDNLNMSCKHFNIFRILTMGWSLFTICNIMSCCPPPPLQANFSTLRQFDHELQNFKFVGILCSAFYKILEVS